MNVMVQNIYQENKHTRIDNNGYTSYLIILYYYCIVIGMNFKKILDFCLI